MPFFFYPFPFRFVKYACIHSVARAPASLLEQSERGDRDVLSSSTERESATTTKKEARDQSALTAPAVCTSLA